MCLFMSGSYHSKLICEILLHDQVQLEMIHPNCIIIFHCVNISSFVFYSTLLGHWVISNVGLSVATSILVDVSW